MIELREPPSPDSRGDSFKSLELKPLAFSIGNRTLNRLPLIEGDTPLHEASFRGLNMLVKREDLTDPIRYGGNKVRNLEFILADATCQKYLEVFTPIPMGSNFSAALVAQSNRLKIRPHLCQVVLAKHPQIVAHNHYCTSHGASIMTRQGPLKYLMQLFDLANLKIFGRRYFIVPGGSNALGAIGHFRAFLEALSQIRKQGLTMPEVLYVGAGTGGTLAGILAAMKYTGISLELVGVRCAEKIICRKSRVVSIANDLLQELGLSQRIKEGDFKLLECPGNSSYGEPLIDFDEINSDLQ